MSNKEDKSLKRKYQLVNQQNIEIIKAANENEVAIVANLMLLTSIENEKLIISEMLDTLNFEIENTISYIDEDSYKKLQLAYIEALNYKMEEEAEIRTLLTDLGVNLTITD